MQANPFDETPSVNRQKTEKKILRTEFRILRNSLTEEEQKLASEKAAALLLSTRAFRRARNVAFYWPNDGELDTLPSILATLQCGKTAMLPVIAPVRGHRKLRFGNATKISGKNRFGIPEPRPTHSIASIDLLIVPLVAYDTNHYRLGMGGGFYDSTLATVFSKTTIGFAHKCQLHHKPIPHEAWDKPLTHIISV